MWVKPEIMRSYPRNLSGRDFILGDLHGMFDELEQLMQVINFDQSADRIFAVGDLVDRGEASFKVLDYLNQDWFNSVKGNHEGILLIAQHDSEVYENWINKYGGHWWLTVDDEAHKQAIIEAFAPLPLFMEIDTDIGLIGIAHADLPDDTMWSELKLLDYSDRIMRQRILLSRERFEKAVANKPIEPIDGVEYVFFGHTTHQHAFKSANSVFLDTGSCFVESHGFGKISLCEIQQPLLIHEYDINAQRHQQYSL